MPELKTDKILLNTKVMVQILNKYRNIYKTCARKRENEGGVHFVSDDFIVNTYNYCTKKKITIIVLFSFLS